jgi:peptidoglycan/xylan/chitin deacetylase (PgdA/CDA1 family)
MVFRPPRTVTATACALLAAGGLSACRHHVGPTRAAVRTPPIPATRAQRRQQAVTSPQATAAPPTPSPTVTISPSHPAPSRTPLPPVISHLPVKDKIVFITIDDGWEKDPGFVTLVRERKVPLTLFLTNSAIRNDYDYFRGLQESGALVEDHTMTHAYLPKLPYARQKHEICAAADIYARKFGTRPTLFRAPYGATTHVTLRAARDCGMRAVFFWREVVTGGRIAYQLPGHLHPGDILLVHFNPHMAADFARLLRTIGKQGFRPAALRDNLPASYFGQG